MRSRLLLGLLCIFLCSCKLLFVGGDKRPSGGEIEPQNNQLAGKTYTRTFIAPANPLSGQPENSFAHTIHFDSDALHFTDNSSQAFGNPPVTGTYRVDGDKLKLRIITVNGTYREENYSIAENGRTLANDSGIVLKLQ